MIVPSNPPVFLGEARPPGPEALKASSARGTNRGSARKQRSARRAARACTPRSTWALAASVTICRPCSLQDAVAMAAMAAMARKMVGF